MMIELYSQMNDVGDGNPAIYQSSNNSRWRKYHMSIITSFAMELPFIHFFSERVTSSFV